MNSYKKPLAPAEIADLSDRQIDFSDIPELDDAFWRNARVLDPRTGPETTAPKTTRAEGRHRRPADRPVGTSPGPHELHRRRQPDQP